MRADWVRYANQGATRRLPLNERLIGALSFLPELGVEMEVFSGGQPEKGSGLARVGSTRHDHGDAADVFFYKDGRKLDWNNPQDRPLFQEIVRRGKAAGLTGFGAGPGYMQPGSMHVGFGKPAVWGAGGKGANAPDWLREAYGQAPLGNAPETDSQPSNVAGTTPDGTPIMQAGAAQEVTDPTVLTEFGIGTTPTDMPTAEDVVVPMQVAERKKVTDPALLETLNSGGRKKVSDPALLEKLNAEPVTGATTTQPAGGGFRTLDSFMRSVADVATFGFADEISAGLGAATGIGGEFGDYEGNLERQRAEDAARRAEDPVASIAGTVTGALGTGVIAAPARAMTLGAYMRQGAALGAGSGAAYGFGSGEGVEDRVSGAATGAAVGGALGGATPLATNALGATYRGAKNAIGNRANALFRPGQEAGRRVGSALSIDRANVPTLSAADEAAASINNQPILNVDRGGEMTRAVARSAANQDPEARAIVDRVVSDRFATQGQRAQSFIDRITSGKADDLVFQDNLKAAARKANAPAYKKAYREGSEMILTPEMERLMSSRAVGRAMKEVATGKGKDRAVAEGAGSFNPGVKITEDGRVVFNRTKAGSDAFPDLQFWDYTKRELDDMAKAARRAGKNEEATTLEGLARALRSELDTQVPSYANARAGAAAFFGAEDALEAGRKFVTQNRTIGETARALDSMSKPEREAFAIGFAAEMKDAIKQSGDRTNVIKKIFGSEQARDKIRLALGNDAFKEFEQFVKVENVMDQLRGAMGNSTTARQLAELGLAGSVGGAAGLATGDWQTGLVAGLAVRGARAYGAKVDEKMSKQIAKLLLSSDPKDIEKLSQMAVRRPRIQKAIRGINDMVRKATIVEGAREGTDALRPDPLEITVGQPALAE